MKNLTLVLATNAGAIIADDNGICKFVSHARIISEAEQETKDKKINKPFSTIAEAIKKEVGKETKKTTKTTPAEPATK
jgi:hypothetical protein